MTTTTKVRSHAATALPRVVPEEEWRQFRDQLLIAEKAHTHAGDAVAAQRRRLPMTEVDATLEVTGREGHASLLDMFEGRRQLIVYHHMLKPDDEHPCPGCSAFTDHVPHLAHLHVADVTFAMELQHRTTSSRRTWSGWADRTSPSTRPRAAASATSSIPHLTGQARLG